VENKQEPKFIKTLVITRHQAQFQRYLRHRSTHGKALMGYRCLTLANLALTIAEQTTGPAKIASSAQIRTAVKQAVTEVVKDDPGWNTRGCIRSLLQIFTDIRVSRFFCGTDIKPQNGSQKVQIVLDLLKKYETILAGKLDEAALYGNLHDVLTGKKDLPPVLSDLGQIEIIGFTDPLDWQEKLIQALEQCLAFRRSQRSDSVPVIPDAILSVMTGIGGRTDLPASDKIEFHQFADTAIERRWLGRRLSAMLAGVKRAGNSVTDPVDPEQILVIVPGGNDVRRRVATVLDMYQIPHDAAVMTPLSQSPFGSFLLKFIKLDPDSIDYNDLIWLLSSPFVSASGLWSDGQRQSPRSLAQQLRKHKLRNGTIAEWKKAIGELQEYYEKLAGLDTDEDPSLAENHRRTAAGLKQLKKPFENLLDRLANLLKTPDNKPLADWTDWGLDVIKKLGSLRKIKAQENADEESCVQQVKDCLFSIPSVSAEAMDKKSFVDLLNSELSALTDVDQVSWTAAVSVRSPDEVEDGSWRYGFVVGMTSQALPAVIRPQGILSDPDKEHIGLDTAEKTNWRAEKQLANALKRVTGHLAMSFSILGADGKAALPSVFFQRLEDASADYDEKGSRKIGTGFLAYKGQPAWFEVHSAHEIIADNENAVLDFECTVRNRLCGIKADDEACNSLKSFINPNSWGEDAVYSSFGKVKTDGGFSPSRLDTFGKCPYRYFAENVLKLKRIRELDLDPESGEVGTALHDALENSVKSVLDDKGPAYFCCESEGQKEERKKTFDEFMKEEIKKNFGILFEKGMTLEKDALEGLIGRWTQTLQTTFPDLFFIDPAKDFISRCQDIESQWQQKEKELLEKISTDSVGTNAAQANAKTAKELLDKFNQARINHQDLPIPQGFPRGYTPLFNALIGFHNELVGLCDNDKNSQVFWQPQKCELKFGSAGPHEVFLNKGEMIPLKGTIDRIDSRFNDPDVIRILDYKSGKNDASKEDRTLKNECQEGINFQLPCYVLAARSVLKSHVIQAGICSLRRPRGIFLTIDNAWLQIAEHWLSRCQEHVNSGRLAPYPKADCPRLNGVYAYCDFPDLCRHELIPPDWFDQGYKDLHPLEKSEPEKFGPTSLTEKDGV
jgi:hypothetical protein